MPNWCENRVYIETSSEEIAAIVAAINAQDNEDVGLLNYLRPQPEYGDDTSDQVMPNWWNWRIENWGTKWEVQAEITSHDVEGGWINLAFESAWSPPVEALEHWASQSDDRNFNIRYIEWGMMFCGEADSREESTYFEIPASVEEAKAIIPVELNEEFGISEAIAQWIEDEAEEQEQVEA